MKGRQIFGNRAYWVVAALLALLLLAGFWALHSQVSGLTDLNDSSALSELIAKTSGHENAQVQAVKSEGNLAVVSYSADGRQGILLLERTGGQDDGRCRLVDWDEADAGLHTYQTSLNGVVDLTVLYGENTQGGREVTLMSGDASASYTLAEGSVLELSMNPGASSGSETELLYCGG